MVAGERASRDDKGDITSTDLLAFVSQVRDRARCRPAGVDVSACTAAVRDVICSLEDVHTSLVAQLFWVGFRRQLVAI